MIFMPEQYPKEVRERAVRLVAEHRGDYETEYAAIRSIAAKLGIATPETLRQWVRQAEAGTGQRPGVTSGESAEIRRLREEVKELRRANEILKAASAFFATELYRPLTRSTGGRDNQYGGQRGPGPRQG
jgi:transposase